jgi:hypothetical protein
LRLRSVLAAAVGAALALPSIAVAAPRVLTPSGPWHLDYAADSCTLARTFGAGDDEVSIRFEQFQPGPTFALTFIGKAFRSSQLYRPVKLAFGPGQPLRAVDGAMSGSATTADKRTLDMLFVSSATLAGVLKDDQIEPPLPAPIDERAISEVALVQLNGADFVLKLGPMDKPMEQVRVCIDELVSHWGIDATKQRTLTRQAKPVGSPGQWFRSSDYPTSSLGRGESALIHFRLTIAADGRVADCAIQRATKGDEFAKKSCEQIRKRARFEPALDAEGKPVASFYVNTVKWLAAPP